jgi:hypothetical protein
MVPEALREYLAFPVNRSNNPKRGIIAPIHRESHLYRDTSAPSVLDNLVGNG